MKYIFDFRSYSGFDTRNCGALNKAYKDSVNKMYNILHTLQFGQDNSTSIYVIAYIEQCFNTGIYIGHIVERQPKLFGAMAQGSKSLGAISIGRWFIFVCFNFCKFYIFILFFYVLTTLLYTLLILAG